MCPSKHCYLWLFLLERSVAVAVLAAAIASWQWRRRRRCLDAKRSSSPHRQSSLSPTKSATLAAKIDFLERMESRYGYANSKKGFIDDWRSCEFPKLIPPLKLRPSRVQQKPSPESSSGHYCNDAIALCNESSSEPEVYLDYAGSAIPTRTLLSHMISHHAQILANPHSQGGGLASDRTLKLIQLTKDRIKQHFGIQHETFGLDELDNEDEYNKIREDNTNHVTPCPGYQLVFTSGATESLRLIAERFPWSSMKVTADQKSRIILSSNNNTGILQSNSDASAHYLSSQLKWVKACSVLLYPRNVHTSVIGMRQIALQRGAQFQCVSVDELLGATSEWFRKLTEGSMSYEYRETKIHDAEKKDEGRKDEPGVYKANVVSGKVENTTGEPTTCKTIWIHHLLVLPLECNFGGDRFDWSNTAAMARESCSSSYLHCSSENDERITIRVRHKWHILLDTAKAAATSPVDLPTLAHGGPDFAVVSFYKMFGAPTGLGALFVKKHRRRKQSGERVTEERDETNESQATDASYMTTYSVPKKYYLSGGITVERSISPRQFFGGGSVDVVLAEKDFMVPRNFTTNLVNGSIGSDEDEHIDLGVMVHGTEHFRGIASLVHGFQELDDLGGMEAISSHSTCLAEELVQRLRKLVHDNGTTVVHLYGQWKSFVKDKMTSPNNPGPTIAFNICDRDGSPIGYDEVSRLATLTNPPIQLRTGCFCNPGACQDAISLSNADVLKNYASGHVCGDRRGVLNGLPTGAIRVSFGKDSIWEDLDALVAFIENVFVSRGETLVTSHSPEESADPNNTERLRIDELYVFPIKSCAAMRVNRWPIDRRTGRLAFDREFALVDTSGSAMRLHSYPKMSDIHSDIDLNTKTLTVTAPNHEDLILNLKKPNLSADHSISPEDVQVCGTLCKGSIWGGSKAARWFSSVLGVRCWLARHQDAGKTEKISDDNERHAYCNEASLLLVSQQSISILNSVITAQGWGRLVESRHFRPNIVVSSNCQGGNETKKQIDEKQKATNPEDSWQQIIIRGSTDVVELTAVGKCARCQMVDIDPSSGMKGNTLRALAQYRRDRGKINFGTFFAPSTPAADTKNMSSNNTNNNDDASEGNAWLEEGSEVQQQIPR